MRLRIYSKTIECIRCKKIVSRISPIQKSCKECKHWVKRDTCFMTGSRLVSRPFVGQKRPALKKTIE